MVADRIDGKAFAVTVREKVAGHVARLKADHGITPGLAVIIVGEDPASEVYVRSKGSKAKGPRADQATRPAGRSCRHNRGDSTWSHRRVRLL